MRKLLLAVIFALCSLCFSEEITMHTGDYFSEHYLKTGIGEYYCADYSPSWVFNDFYKIEPVTVITEIYPVNESTVKVTVCHKSIYTNLYMRLSDVLVSQFIGMKYDENSSRCNVTVTYTLKSAKLNVLVFEQTKDVVEFPSE